MLASASSSISFEPFEEFTQSKNNAAYIIAVFFISLCFLLAFGAPLLKTFFSGKGKKED